MIDIPSLSSSSVSSAKECLSNNLFDLLSSLDPSITLESISAAISLVDTSALTANVESLLAQKLSGASSIQSKAIQMAKESQYLNRVSKEAKIASAHNNQDAKRSISFSEPIPAESGKSQVKDQKSPDYSCQENYPLSYGSVDEANNWYKINQETGDIEFVHNSGSFLKMDKAGNATIKITGSLKWIIDKDLLLQVINMSEVVKGDKYLHVFGQNEETVGKASTQQSGGTHTVKSSANTVVKGSQVLIN